MSNHFLNIKFYLSIIITVLLSLVATSLMSYSVNTSNQGSVIIESVVVLNATCGLDNGVIIVMASGANDLEYSIDQGATYQTSNTFDNLTNNDFLVTVRSISNNSCSEVQSAQILNDTNPPEPEIINCAPTLEVLCNDTVPTLQLDQWVTTIDAVDFRTNQLVGTLDDDAVALIDFTDCNTLYPLTMSVTDTCGRAVNCLTEINIIDETLPEITCPVELTIDISDLTYPETVETWLETIMATDNCSDPSTTNDLDESRILGGLGDFQCEPTFTLDVEFLATDACGNTEACASSIFVINELMPDIVCDAGLIVECGIDPEELLDDLLIQFEDINAFDEDITVQDDANIEDIIGLECGETATIIFSVIDGCGRLSDCIALVEIEDTTLPEITNCPSTLIIDAITDNTETEINAWLVSFEAEDLCTIGIIYDNNFDDNIFMNLCGQSDTIDLTFTAADFCQNLTSCNTQLYIAPQEITINCPQTLITECGDTDQTIINQWLTQAESFDQDDNTVFVSNNYEANIIESCDTIIEIQFTALNPCMAESTCIGQIQFIDETAPVLDCPESFDISVTEPNLEGVIMNWSESYTVSDNCFSTIEADNDLAFEELDLDCGNIETIVYTATDICGNTITCSTTLEIINDRESFALNCADSLTLRCTSPSLLSDIEEFISSTPIDGAQLIDDFDPTRLDLNCNQLQTIDILFTLQDSCIADRTCVTSLILLPDAQVYIPNIISMTNAGVNNTFTVYGNSSVAEVTQFRIYDRWGNIAWQKEDDFVINDESKGWKVSSLDNRTLGVYTYIIEVRDAFSEILPYSGNLTVIK